LLFAAEKEKWEPEATATAAQMCVRQSQRGLARGGSQLQDEEGGGPGKARDGSAQ